MNDTKLMFKAALNKVTRGSEDETKVVLECDAQQLYIISMIPTQKLLKITVEVEE